MKIETKRVYEEPDESDGYRILTERLWPRGVSKERGALDERGGTESRIEKIVRLGFGKVAGVQRYIPRRAVCLRGGRVTAGLDQTTRNSNLYLCVYRSNTQQHNSAEGVSGRFVNQLSL